MVGDARACRDESRGRYERVAPPGDLPLSSRSMRILVSLAAAIFLSVLVGFTLVGGEQVIAAQAARNVWDGVFTAAQAERGRGFYLANCAECHGDNLEGGEKQALKGDRFWADWQETTVDYMLGRISKNMPFSEDGSLAGTLGTPTYVDI